MLEICGLGSLQFQGTARSQFRPGSKPVCVQELYKFDQRGSRMLFRDEGDLTSKRVTRLCLNIFIAIFRDSFKSTSAHHQSLQAFGEIGYWIGCICREHLQPVPWVAK